MKVASELFFLRNQLFPKATHTTFSSASSTYELPDFNSRLILHILKIRLSLSFYRLLPFLDEKVCRSSGLREGRHYQEISLKKNNSRAFSSEFLLRGAACREIKSPPNDYELRHTRSSLHYALDIRARVRSYLLLIPAHCIYA